MKKRFTYTSVTFSTSLLSFLYETLLSSQLHKKNKNYMKQKPKLQTIEWPYFYSLFDLPSASDVWSIYRIKMDKEMSGEIRELDISEFESFSYLQT